MRKYDRESGEYKQVAYAGYKAQRAAMPEDLAQQVPYIRRALEIYRIPILEAAGFEADDVIGTLARLASEQSYAVYVVSSDKDMLQLVDERVCVLNPPKDNLICDRAKVEEILGVPPERVIDVMALRGDSIDNVPGAPGIGDKGSVELIQRFGSLDNLLEHVAEVERKTYRESLLHNRDAVLLSRRTGDDRPQRGRRVQSRVDESAAARRARGAAVVYRTRIQFVAQGVSGRKHRDWRNRLSRGEVGQRCGSGFCRRAHGRRIGNSPSKRQLPQRLKKLLWPRKLLNWPRSRQTKKKSRRRCSHRENRSRARTC